MARGAEGETEGVREREPVSVAVVERVKTVEGDRELERDAGAPVEEGVREGVPDAGPSGEAEGEAESARRQGDGRGWKRLHGLHSTGAQRLRT